MECPICGSDLIDEGVWGYLALHQSGEVLGRTYRCPNHEGFENEDAANDFLKMTERTIEDLNVTTWEEITCDSSMHSVSGSFYTDNQDNLHEGYPC
jgi:hypothetical protein